MKTYDIRSAEDVRRIEQSPYETFMRHTSVHDALADTASRHGDRRALTMVHTADLDGPCSHWTHAQLLAEVRRTANLFHGLAEGEPARIAVLLPAIPQNYMAWLGGETAGVVCPINFLLNAQHIAELVKAANCNILVALGPNDELDIWSKVAGLRAACPSLKHVLAVNVGATPAEGAQDFDALRATQPGDRLVFDRTVGANTLAALFHTGGTTGLPKLAQHTHGNQLHTAWATAQMWAANERDVIVNGFPLFHVAGSLLFGFGMLLSGAEVVLPTLLAMRNTAFMARFWPFVERLGATIVTATPTGIATLLNADRTGVDIGRVRMLLTGGSLLPNELAQSFENGTGIVVRNTLGMTECAGAISSEPFHLPRTPGGCGIPLPFCEVQVAPLSDPSGEVALPVGQSGMLRARGRNVGPGYTDPARNAGAFANGWLLSGDIGHVDARGQVFVTGRAKDVIIRNTHNIDPGQIEDALLAHPDVQLAAAVGEPDEYAGEVPVAYVVAKPGHTIDVEAVRAFVQAHIPERPAWPKRIEVMEQLPHTAVGKVYKPSLRLHAMEHALHERLQAVGLAQHVRVSAREEGHHLVAVFSVLAEGRVPDVAARLREMMLRFAFPYRIDGAVVA